MVHVLLEYILQLVLSNVPVAVDVEHFEHFPNVFFV